MSKAAKKFRQLYYYWSSAFTMTWGVLGGILYSVTTHSDTLAGESRFLISMMFLTAGIMGFVFFTKRIQGDAVPSQVEDERFFSLIWFFLGVILLIRFFNEPPISASASGYVTTFCVGYIVAIVWLIMFKWFIGLKWGVSSWDVLPFPMWIVYFVAWIVRKIAK